MVHFYVLFRRQQQIIYSFLQMDDITEDELENLRQTYDRTYDNLTTNRKIFFVIWPQHCIVTVLK